MRRGWGFRAWSFELRLFFVPCWTEGVMARRTFSMVDVADYAERQVMQSGAAPAGRASFPAGPRLPRHAAQTPPPRRGGRSFGPPPPEEPETRITPCGPG